VLRNDLQRAMLEHEFLVHTQPLVDLTSGRTIGAEALLRWQHPVRGLLTPISFLDLAEESGMMREIGRRVLRDSCRLATAWPEDTTISVNVSRSQLLADDRLVDEVAEILQETGLTPSRLLLEVTEFAVTSNLERAITMLGDLAALGVRIAMDDFGTGYSSLQHLARLPVHVLKVAKPFVESLDSVRGDQASLIARGVIQMAEALGLDTIAEGIEEPEQAQMLRGWGCRVGQGYLLGRPMPPRDLRILAGWGPPDPDAVAVRPMVTHGAPTAARLDH
jgi:EAL domain-containing protein (putative c-di-GMP-specific phosphodiesterase class I)